MNPDIERNKSILSITKFLDEISYPDSSRIAKEIVTYSENYGVSLDEIRSRLLNDEPWEYICHNAHFFGSDFYVDESVLIPRQETEDLLRIVIDDYKNSTAKNMGIVEIGSGSGCIIISLAIEIVKLDSSAKKAKFTATEISKKASQVTQGNADQLLSDLDISISVINCNLLDDFEPQEDLDLYYFVANLPYLTEGQISSADRSVKNWEPKLALRGDGIDGLGQIKSLIHEISTYPINSKIYLEVDPSQVSFLKEFTERLGGFSFETSQDRFERDRFVIINSL